MKTPKACIVAVTATAGITLTSTVARGDSENNDRVAELERMVQSLQQEVRTLRTEDGQISEARADEIRSLVQDVLADADTRASLLQSGMTSGYDGGFVLGSADGVFSMKINGQMQARLVWNNQDENSGDTNRYGFEMRRTKLKFKGHIGDPSWGYAINGAYDSGSGVFVLEDAYLTKDLENNMTLYLGQYKPPYMREELVSSTSQLAVERSLVNEEFNQDRSIGAGLQWVSDDDQFRVHGMLHNGHGNRNQSALSYDTEIAFDARVEYLASGTWGQFKTMTSPRGSEQGLLIGGAFHYEVEEYGTLPGPEIENFGLTVDAAWHDDGWNASAALVYETYDDGAAVDASRLGVVIQGGYYLNEVWEIFARYEYGDYDTTGVENLSVLTFGANNYLSPHVKWSTDLGFGLDEVNGPWASTGAGWRADATGDDGQVVLRSQLQLVF